MQQSDSVKGGHTVSCTASAGQDGHLIEDGPLLGLEVLVESTSTEMSVSREPGRWTPPDAEGHDG